MRITAESEAILSSPVFQRSPALSGLLRYLVQETIAGRANALKSFIVAVDALGRKEDFDSASDSSARVQMGRLRKALESYYEHNGPSDSECLYLQPGSYIVRLAPLSVAYPTLYRPLPNSNATVDEDSEPEGDPDLGVEPDSTSRNAAMSFARFLRRPYMLGLMLLGSMVLGAATIETWQSKPSLGNSYYSPVLEIFPIDSGTNPVAIQTSRMIASLLADDLSRFKISRVRLQTSTRAEEKQEDGQANLYRLYSRVVTDADDKVTLYVNIDDARANVLIWSRIVVMPPNAEAAGTALSPVTAEINGPQGIIASYESLLARNSDEGGYPCLLKYFEFSRVHGDVLENSVESCLVKPVTEQSLAATMLGIRAMFELERSSAVENLDAAYERGIIFARAGVEADANDGWANFAMARLSFFKRDCAAARFYTDRTMISNPNSPVFSSVLAGLAPMCDYPFAQKLLDQAIATQSPFYAKSRLWLVLGAISQNRPEKISEIYQGQMPLTRDNRSSYYLTEAMIAASKNDRFGANRYWNLFEANAPKKSKTSDDKLRNIVMIPAVRQKVIRYLRNAGVSIT